MCCRVQSRVYTLTTTALQAALSVHWLTSREHPCSRLLSESCSISSASLALLSLASFNHQIHSSNDLSTSLSRRLWPPSFPRSLRGSHQVQPWCSLRPQSTTRLMMQTGRRLPDANGNFQNFGSTGSGIQNSCMEFRSPPLFDFYYQN